MTGSDIETKVEFLPAFPEVYREEGSFLQRYLRIFSDIYSETQQEIAGAHRLLSIEEAPEERLLLFAEWLGFDCEKGVFLEEKLRLLLKELCGLNRIKGTPEAVRRAACIVGQGPIRVHENADGAVLLLFPCRWSREKEEKMWMLLDRLLPAGVSCSLHYQGRPVRAGRSAILDAGAALCGTPAFGLDRGGYLGGSKIGKQIL